MIQRTANELRCRRTLSAVKMLAAQFLLVVGSSAPALAADETIEEGAALVQMYCSDCHAIGKTGDSPLAYAPRFRELHLRYDVEDLSEALVEGIVTAHPEMPQFEFDPDQAWAIIAYLKSLEPTSPARTAVPHSPKE